MRVRISGGRVIDPANDVDGRLDLFVADGRVAALGRAPDGFEADLVIDAANRVVCPGLVDLRAHLREPGHEHKATIASESRAAAHSGITTLCCPPTTLPPVDTPAVASLIMRRAEAAGLARVVPLGALTRGLDGEHLSEMAALKQAGCVGVSNDFHAVDNPLILSRAMEYAATFDLTVFINPQDPRLANNGTVHDGAVCSRLGLSGIPAAAETVAVASCLALVERIGVRTHFSLLSTARGAQMIARAQHDGMPVTADVSAHHLHLTENDVLDFDSQCHVMPPLRTLRDRDGLRQWLSRGTIAAICSDHQPHEADAKLAPFGETATGISALETLLPLSLRLVDDGVMTLNEMIASLTVRPARILGIEAGDLAPGRRADVCVFDPDHYWVLNRDRLVSRGHNTPFLDWELKGRVTHTLLAGIPVYALKPGD
ncbi:MAG: dihydroorotase [Gammaproteobacteria bacterium]|nr:dihydroorotase [Gammaproteobacteria bacterium]